eukprot:6194650-Pleurochrysis_carterae.AAC.4
MSGCTPTRDYGKIYYEGSEQGDLVRQAGNEGYSHVDAGSHGRGTGAGAGTKRTYGGGSGQNAQRAAAAMREQGF